MNKGKIINFEWLRDGNIYSEDQFTKIKMNLIEKEVELAVSSGYNKVIGIYLMDGFLPYSNIQFSKEIKNIKKILNEYGVTDSLIVSGHGESIGDIGLPYKYFDYTLRMTYRSYEHILNDLPKYEGSKEKFLLLGGTSARPNRIGLFSTFYENKLFDNCLWTFFPPSTPNDKRYCREYLSHYTDDQYIKFLNFCNRSLDTKYSDVYQYLGDYSDQSENFTFYDIVDKEWTKDIVFLDPSVFSKTSFSVITEGDNFWNSNYNFVTEKTWRTILHQHPFIFAGHPGQFRYLKSLGIRTFENYMKIQDYAYIEDDNLRFKAIVENTRNFLDSQHNFYVDIKEDVEYNYNLVLDRIKDQETFFHHLIQEYQISKQDIDYYFNRKGYDQLIRNPANGI